MSDFLARIAARAVGARSLARPRVPFSIVGTASAGLEVVDEEVALPGAAVAPPVRRPARLESRQRPESTQAQAASSAASRPAVAYDASPAVMAAEHARERSVPALESVPIAPADAEPDASPAVARAQPAAPVATASPPPAKPASVPAALAPRPAAAPRTAVAARRNEPPPVRVHIGRLEVRASVAEPPRPQPLPEPREPEGLSLSDYLRGRRGA